MRGAVLLDAWRRLRRRWPALVALAAAGLVARELILDAAVWAGRHSAVLGLLVLALVPLGAMLVIVAMLLVMRPSTVAASRRVRTVFAVLGSMIVPFLVVYEHYGTLEQDQRQYYHESAHDAVELVSSGVEVGSRVPQAASAVVLGTALGALAVRSLTGRLARRHEPTSLRRGVLQVLGGYCDVVWIVLGVFVIALATSTGRDWLAGRVVAHRVDDWWTGLTEDLQLLDSLSNVAGPVADLLVAGLFVGLVVPISWLAFGTVVYGTQPAAVVSVSGDGTSRTSRLVGRVSARVGDRTVERAWQASLDSERRFGPLIGGVAMIWRSGWNSALLFCLAYVAVGQAGYLVWGAARLAVGPAPVIDWLALARPVDMVTTIVVQVLSAALLAAAADALVGRLTVVAAVPSGSGGRASPGDAPAKVRSAGQPVGSSQ
ncbi:hypothetical protein [Jiangella asiatica]|uniref:Uncharacterized protein n=1 Tax=Jiangella asiatica TaxID=2530372 RepID=A0A4R5D7M6_9ACTN|nr:hypothetical protein [Jiangella asiatica]TDE09509.1 hypothetical protein E1269_14440 [Jiangella asiatica]